jgi:GntP family gluconate:H+ symporter
MITTASIVAPLTISLGLNTDLSLALSVLAIGAGSTVVSHAPDSYFWIVTQMSGMSVSQGYKTHTVASGLLGLSAMVMIYFVNLFFT